MKIKDIYNIDADDLEIKAEENEYWAKANDFYNQVKEKTVDELSLGQRNWLDKIEHGMNK